MDVDRIRETVYSLAGRWEPNFETYSACSYDNNRQFKTYKFKVGTINVGEALTFRVDEKKEQINVHLRCKYTGEEKIGAKSRRVHFGKEDWSTTASSLDDLKEKIKALQEQAGSFESSQF